MTSPDAGVPGEQRNDDQDGSDKKLREINERWEKLFPDPKLTALRTENADLRVELQAARNEAAAARKDAAEADYVTRATGEKLTMVREQRDQATTDLAAARRTLDERDELLRRIVLDYGHLCDNHDSCHCSMGTAVRLLAAAVPETRDKETRHAD